MTNFVIRVTVDGKDNASPAFKKLNKQLDATKRKAKEVSKATGGSNGLLSRFKQGGSAINNMSGALLGLGSAFAVVQLGKRALEIANHGQAVTITTAKYEALNKSILGLSDGQGTLEQLRAVTGGIVDDLTLKGATNDFLQRGLATNNEELNTLINLAVKLKNPMLDAGQAVTKFGLLLANQSILRLDEFGLSAGRVRARMKELIASGQAVGREDAFRMSVMEEGAVALDNLGDSATAAETATARLGASLKNLGDDISEGIGRGLEDVAQSVEGLIGILDLLATYGTLDAGGIQTQIDAAKVEAMQRRGFAEIAEIMGADTNRITSQARSGELGVDELTDAREFLRLQSFGQRQSGVASGINEARAAELDQARIEGMIRGFQEGHLTLADLERFQQEQVLQSQGVGEVGGFQTGTAKIGTVIDFDPLENPEIRRSLERQFLADVNRNQGNEALGLAPFARQQSQEFFGVSQERADILLRGNAAINQFLRQGQKTLDAVAVSAQNFSEFSANIGRDKLNDSELARQLSAGSLQGARNLTPITRLRRDQRLAEEAEQRALEFQADSLTQGFSGIEGLRPDIRQSATGFDLLSGPDAQIASDLADNAETMLAAYEELHNLEIIDDAEIENARGITSALRDAADQANDIRTNLANMSLGQLFGQGDGGRLGEVGDVALSFIQDDEARAAAQRELDLDTGRETDSSLALQENVGPILGRIGDELGPEAFAAATDRWLTGYEEALASGLTEAAALTIAQRNLGYRITPGVGGAGAGDYTVQDGDTVSAIAAANNMTTAEFYKLNPELGGSSLITTGQQFNLGGGGGGGSLEAFGSGPGSAAGALPEGGSEEMPGDSALVGMKTEAVEVQSELDTIDAQIIEMVNTPYRGVIEWEMVFASLDGGQLASMPVLRDAVLKIVGTDTKPIGGGSGRSSSGPR